MISPTNPGNIRYNPDYSGIVGNQNGFAVFKNEGYGYKAIYSTLSTYLNRYGLNTISQIGARYAPASENNTQLWINTVSQKSGINPNDIIQPSNFYRIISGIVKAENSINIDPDKIISKIDSANNFNFLPVLILCAIFGTLIFTNGKTKI
jgi:hypothetical protein